MPKLSFPWRSPLATCLRLFPVRSLQALKKTSDGSAPAIPVVHPRSGMHACNQLRVGDVAKSVAGQEASVDRRVLKPSHKTLKPAALKDFNARMSNDCSSQSAQLESVLAKITGIQATARRMNGYVEANAKRLKFQ